MNEFDPRIWEELHYGRPHGAVPLSVTSLTDVSGPTSLAIGFHLCLVTRPLRIAGYSFAGEAFQETNYRLWVHRANEQTGLPVGAAIAKSDTGVRLIGPGTSTATRRDSIRTPAIDDFASALVATRYVDLLLPNVVEILVPGVYWIGIARSKIVTGGELWYGSYIRSHLRGLRDLMSTHVTTSMSGLDPSVLTAMDPSLALLGQKFYLTTAASTGRICNVDIALITEEWFNG